jgi:hypothetical protein
MPEEERGAEFFSRYETAFRLFWESTCRGIPGRTDAERQPSDLVRLES